MKQYSPYERAIYEPTLLQDSPNIIISPSTEPFLRYRRISRNPHPPSLHPRTDLFAHGKDLFPERILDNLPNQLFLVGVPFGHLLETNQSNALLVGLTQSEPPILL